MQLGSAQKLLGSAKKQATPKNFLEPVSINELGLNISSKIVKKLSLEPSRAKFELFM